MRQIRVMECFAGIGSQIQALKNLGIPCESVISEIDKYAIKSYEAVHGPTQNLGDISKIRELPNGLDLLTYSFPCQDLSIAGDRKGMDEGSGTRSSLLWEVGRLLKHHRTMTDMGLAEMPKILVMENVPAILNKNNMPNFQKWIDELTELGYTSSYAVLNAKDFGIPQNRKRCFMVSTLDGKKFRFPTGVPLDKCLRDMLEDEVGESYYFSDEKIARYEEHRVRHKMAGHGFGWKPTKGEGIAVSVTGKPDRQSSNIVVIQGDYVPTEIVIAGDLNDPHRHESANRVYGKEGVCPTIPTGTGGGHIPRIDDSIAYPCMTKKGYMEAREGDGLVMNRPTRARGTVQSQSTPTLTTGNGCGSGTVTKGLRIRYLTEKECWRLMGFPDEAFDKAKAAGISKTQLYKQAGNSIVVNVLEAIFKGIYIDETWE